MKRIIKKSNLRVTSKTSAKKSISKKGGKSHAKKRATKNVSKKKTSNPKPTDKITVSLKPDYTLNIGAQKHDDDNVDEVDT